MYVSPHQLQETSSTYLAWQKHTKDDFEGFLTCRAREFKQKGMLALVLSSRPKCLEGIVFLKVETENRFWTLINTKKGLWDCLKETKITLFKNGIINKYQCQKLFVPVYLRSQDEINAALEKFKDIWKIEQWQSEDNICIVDNPVACRPDSSNPPNIQEKVIQLIANNLLAISY